MVERGRNALRIGACVAGLTIAALAISIPSCGGGGGPSTPNGPPATTAPPATTTPPTTLPAGGGPTLDARLSTKAGKQPLQVSFDLSRSRDGGGGTSLRYLADFEGDTVMEAQPGPHFTHSYKSDGVTVRHTILCVEDGAGRRDCATESIKTYVDVDLSVKQNTGCQGTIDATAVLKLNGFDVRAAGEVDHVEFEAFDATGRRIGTRDGQKQNPKQWMSGTWNVNDTTKLRVKATVFSNGIRGDDIPEDNRPPC
jgi:hypothetical protein